jgi:hypothetical protein
MGWEERAGTCFQFKKTGACEFGARCKYLHDATARPPSLPVPAPSTGGAGACSAGSKPLLEPLGICFQFKKTGSCEFGARCKYLHDDESRPRAPTGTATGSRHGGDTSTVEACAQRSTSTGADSVDAGIEYDTPAQEVQGHPTGHSAAPAQAPANSPMLADAAPVRTGEPPKGVCFMLWRTGKCGFGPGCRYSHRVDTQPAATAPSAAAAGSSSALASGVARARTAELPGQRLPGGGVAQGREGVLGHDCETEAGRWPKELSALERFRQPPSPPPIRPNSFVSRHGI